MARRSKENPAPAPAPAPRLARAGVRPTRQRIELAELLWAQGHRHVTAEILHGEAQRSGTKISLATVYNTLNEFTRAGLLREIVMPGGRTCFDTNTDPHHHFLHEDTGRLEDVDTATVKVKLGGKCPLPQGMSVAGVDVVIRLTRAAAR